MAAYGRQVVRVPNPLVMLWEADLLNWRKKSGQLYCHGHAWIALLRGLARVVLCFRFLCGLPDLCPMLRHRGSLMVPSFLRRMMQCTIKYQKRVCCFALCFVLFYMFASSDHLPFIPLLYSMSLLHFYNETMKMAE